MVLDDAIEPRSNLAVFQIKGTLPLEVDFYFASGKRKAPASMPTGESLTRKLENAEAAFDERFERTFQLHKKVGHVPYCKRADSEMGGRS